MSLVNGSLLRGHPRLCFWCKTNERWSREIVGPLAVVWFAPEMTTTVRCFRALPTVMVTASITFERLLNSRLYSGHEMEWARNSWPLNARKTTDNLFYNMTWNRYPVILRFKPVNCLVINTSSSFEQFVLSESLNLVRFHRWKLQIVSIVGSFRFLNVFLKFLLIFTWSFIINYRIRAMYIRDWSRIWAGSRKSRMNHL